MLTIDHHIPKATTKYHSSEERNELVVLLWVVQDPVPPGRVSRNSPVLCILSLQRSQQSEFVYNLSTSRLSLIVSLRSRWLFALFFGPLLFFFVGNSFSAGSCPWFACPVTSILYIYMDPDGSLYTSCVLVTWLIIFYAASLCPSCLIVYSPPP